MADCRKCQRFNACYFDNDDCIGFVQKTMTNADRIRAMSDEELAEYMNGLRMHDGCPNNGALNCKPYCDACWLEWLKKEVDERCPIVM